MKPRFIIQLVLLAAFLAPAHRPSLAQYETVLYPIVDGGKYGYIDENGKVAIRPQFDGAKLFYEGLARVRIGAKWGFIDKSGKLTIPAQFEVTPYSGDVNNSSLDFHEGMAAVSLKEGRKWGYVDRSGRIVVEPKYDVVDRFAEGVASVGNTYSETIGKNATATYIGGAATYIDKQGNVLSFPVVGSTFSEGLALASAPRKRPSTEGVGEEHKTGYIDKTGHFKIEPRLWEPYSFSEGLARVRAYDRDEWGYINHKGQLIIKMIYENAGDFCEGLARVKLYGRMGFVNKSGTLVIRPAFSAVGNFSGGLASACLESATSAFHVKCGYIDRTGKWAIPATFTFILGDFKGKLTLACTEQRCGYINGTGEFMWSLSIKQDNENEGAVFKSSFTGCSIMSDKAERNYPCEIDFKIF